jgi:hypothetical protein
MISRVKCPNEGIYYCGVLDSECKGVNQVLLSHRASTQSQHALSNTLLMSAFLEAHPSLTCDALG